MCHNDHRALTVLQLVHYGPQALHKVKVGLPLWIPAATVDCQTRCAAWEEVLAGQQQWGCIPWCLTTSHKLRAGVTSVTPPQHTPSGSHTRQTQRRVFTSAASATSPISKHQQSMCKQCSCHPVPHTCIPACPSTLLHAQQGTSAAPVRRSYARRCPR